MRDFIADKELSDHQPLQESDALSGSIDAANDDEHEENKKKRSYKKGATLRLDGPIAGLCSLEKRRGIYWANKICTARSHSSRSNAGTQDAHKPGR